MWFNAPETKQKTKNKTRIGVYPWREQNDYHEINPMKVFKQSHAARRYADKLNNSLTEYPEEAPRGYVERAMSEYWKGYEE